jgi:hypothetical protein
VEGGKEVAGGGGDNRGCTRSALPEVGKTRNESLVFNEQADGLGTANQMWPSAKGRSRRVDWEMLGLKGLEP